MDALNGGKGRGKKGKGGKGIKATLDGEKDAGTNADCQAKEWIKV